MYEVGRSPDGGVDGLVGACGSRRGVALSVAGTTEGTGNDTLFSTFPATAVPLHPSESSPPKRLSDASSAAVSLTD